jgi:hypothetical protein
MGQFERLFYRPVKKILPEQVSIDVAPQIINSQKFGKRRIVFGVAARAT